MARAKLVSDVHRFKHWPRARELRPLRFMWLKQTSRFVETAVLVADSAPAGRDPDAVPTEPLARACQFAHHDNGGFFGIDTLDYATALLARSRTEAGEWQLLALSALLAHAFRDPRARR